MKVLMLMNASNRIVVVVTLKIVGNNLKMVAAKEVKFMK